MEEDTDVKMEAITVVSQGTQRPVSKHQKPGRDEDQFFLRIFKGSMILHC
jgi:hypothetical protein